MSSTASLPVAESPAGTTAAPCDLSQLGSLLESQLHAAEEEAQLASALCRFLVEWTNAQAAVYATRAGDRALSCLGTAGPWGTRLAGELVVAADAALRRRHLQVEHSGAGGRTLTMAAPVFDTLGSERALALRLQLAPCESPEAFALLVQLVAGYAGLWQLQHACRQSGWEALASAALVELLVALGQAQGFEAAAQVAVEHLQRLLHCPAVALAWPTAAGSPRLVAVSGHAQCDPRGPLGQSLLSVIRAASVGEPLEAAPGATRLLELTGATRLVAATISQAGTPGQGCLLLCDAAPAPLAPRRQALLEAAATQIGPALRAIQSRPVSWTPGWPGLRGLLASRSKRLWLALAAGLLVLAAWPVVYRVRCTCWVDAAGRRFVTAPFAGRLAEVRVRPGDAVRAGQLLARMDEEPLRHQAGSLAAQRARAAKTRDVALAAHRVADAEQARLEMAQLDLEIKLLEMQLAQLQVTAPLDGLVLSGDLHRATGAPVEQGETLFEIAPPDQLELEVGIPDDEVAHVAVGQAVAVRFDALAAASVEGRVTRIRPAAEVREAQNVFVAEVAVSRWPAGARPGMHGLARVGTARSSLAWVWLHRPWEHWLARWGW